MITKIGKELLSLLNSTKLNYSNKETIIIKAKEIYKTFIKMKSTASKKLFKPNNNKLEDYFN